MGSWGYTERNGPKTWKEGFPIAASGLRQSPIDISTSKATYDAKLAKTPLKIEYQTEPKVNVSNNGHTYKVQITQNSVLKGGPLKNTYKLEQFHLHWGSTNDKGSEHTVNGKMYAAELHLVHWNSDKYKDIAEAVSKEDGLAVLGIFIKAGKHHKDFALLTDAMPKVEFKNSNDIIEQPFNPASLLPKNINDYWTYPGSLTTPPLLESVTWIVFKDVIELSPEQLQAFRSLRCEECGGDEMVNNYRPPLPLGSRLLHASFQ